jgi:Helix-turn-helix domain
MRPVNRPAWTLSEAADRCGVSRSTVRRYRENGKFPNAFKTPGGEWKVPLPDLLAVGWKPTGPEPEQAQPEQVSAPGGQPSEPAMAERVRELEQALSRERARAEAAERLAASFRQNAEDLRMTLRMLEGGKVSSPEPPGEPALSLPSEQAISALSEQGGQAQETAGQPMPAQVRAVPDMARATPQGGPRLLRRLLSRL